MPRKKLKKIFVLDTSVLLYDYKAVRNFEKNDVAVPSTVLEEIDTFKKGNTVTNLHAREFIRYFDGISDANLLQDWIPLNGRSHGKLKVIRNGGDHVDANKVIWLKKITMKYLVQHCVLNLKLNFVPLQDLPEPEKHC